MVRRGSSLLPAVVVGLACLGCSDADLSEPGPLSSAATLAPAPTVPIDAEAGTGTLVIGRETFALTVVSCALDSVLDPDTGITTDLAASATGLDGVVVTVVRSSFVADRPAVTDTITFARPEGVVAESERVDAAGRILDLREPDADDRLIELDGTVIRATGVFGAPDARGPDSTDLDGDLVVRCPVDEP